MAAICNSAMLNSDTDILDSDTLLSSLRFTQKHSHSILTLLWLCLKLIQSDWNSFILIYFDDGRNPEFCHVEFGHLGFSHLSISFQTHSHMLRLVPTICTKILHSFILTQLDDCSHLEFCHVDSDTAMLDSDTLLSSLRFTQKHSHSTLMLTQTNSISLNLMYSHLT